MAHSVFILWKWNIGEAAGAIAGLWLEHGVEPPVAGVQRELARQGVPMVWFDDVGADHPAFAAIQLAALRGIYPMHSDDLHAAPDAPIKRAEAAVALGRPVREEVGCEPSGQVRHRAGLDGNRTIATGSMKTFRFIGPTGAKTNCPPRCPRSHSAGLDRCAVGNSPHG